MPIVSKLNEINGTNLTAKDLGIAFDPKETATSHKMLLMFDQERLERTAQVFNNHIWVIGVNDTNNPLFTSDNPVATHAHKTDDWRSNTGYASPGIEIVLPLTPNYILIMRERSYFHKMEFRDGNISHLDRENIKYYNSLQVYSSNRQVI
jgi:hypothetical protein